MGFYESLDMLVGAGLLASAPAIGVPMPAGKVREGQRFSVDLRGRGSAEPVGAVLDGMARDIWLAQETRGITQSMAEAHAAGLVEVLEAHRPDPAMVAEALQARTPSATAAEIASDLLRRATTSGVIERIGLVEDVAEFMLGVLLSHLLADPALLPALKPTLEDFATAGGPASPTPQVRPPELPESPPLSRPAPDGPAHAVPASRPPPPMPATASSPGRFRELASWLRTMPTPELAGIQDAELDRLKALVADAIAGDELEAAAGRLRSLRRHLIEARRRSETRLNQEILNLARQQTEEAMATAGLAEVAFARRDFATAATLFGEAIEAAAAEMPDTARRLRLRRGDALLRQSEPERAAGPLREAALIYADVLRQARAAGDKVALAAADLGVGQVMLRQAEWGDRPEVLAEAAESFRRAAGAIDRDDEPRLWADARVALANALALSAERDPAATGHAEAAAAYQDALAVISPIEAPLEWAMTQVRLGAVLVRLADQGQQSSSWLAAAAAMVRALEVFEQQGAEQQAALARSTLRQFHERWPALTAAR